MQDALDALPREEVSRPAHGVQVALDVAPTADEWVPAAQREQVVAPTADEWVPAAQREQVALDVAPTADEWVPAAQREQVALPREEGYVPAVQSVQDPDVVEARPTGQLTVQVEAPAVEEVSSGQTVLAPPVQ